MIRISKQEKDFLRNAIEEHSFRLDGRSLLDYRTFTVETGVVQQANGSARVRLGQRGTDVLVGVKVEIGTPDSEFPDQGKLQIHVECSPSAAREFQGRGAVEVTSQLVNTLKTTLHSSTDAINWKSLCISPGKFCWIVYVDCLVLDSDGNLIDALSIATRAALFNTKIPKIEVLEMEDGNIEIEANDDPSEFTKLQMEGTPICVTLGKIGNKYSVDPSLEEELCTEARITIAVNQSGNIVATQKVGEGMQPTDFVKILHSAKKIGTVLLRELQKLLEEEEKLDLQVKVGFMQK